MHVKAHFERVDLEWELKVCDVEGGSTQAERFIQVKGPLIEAVCGLTDRLPGDVEVTVEVTWQENTDAEVVEGNCQVCPHKIRNSWLEEPGRIVS